MLPPFDPRTLLRLFGGIDALPRGATGALSFSVGQRPQGTILIENGRVCWAAAEEMENRLTDILRAGSERPAGAFEEIYQECYRDQKPLGETLVARGLVTSDGLRSALKEHSAEAIARLAAATKLEHTWRSKGARGYDARFTFGTPELLCWIGSMSSRAIAEEADRKLRDITPESSVGLAFSARSDTSLPLAHVSADDWSCRALIQLGEWARAALGNGEAAEGESVLESDSVSSLKRAWLSGDIIFVRWTGEETPK